MSAATSFLRYLRRTAKSSSSGFTLIELLVTVILAGGIVSGLMYLAVETLQSDQRESDRTETQRDMQLALTFMQSELRQAIYVYNAECLDGTDAECQGTANWGNLNLPAGMTPVLAFWRLQPIPQAVQTAACSSGAPTNVPCLAGNSYSLVVYSWKQRDPGPFDPSDPFALRGQAGLFRSEMSITDTALTGYADPFNATPQFKGWPAAGDAPVFSQPELLVDFVDDGNGSLAAGDTPSCPAVTDVTYQLTPSDNIPRSFYACVSQPDSTIGNQDVVIYLRGNAAQRSGIMRENTFLPPIETRVFIRGTLDKKDDS
ncbi:MAG: prepilin-type N-terminal cleavage/methylation domain-containing protein [Elainellaceae cyanobacterium]